MKSITDCLIFIGGMLFKSTSKRQKAVVTSTHWAEFIALKYAVEEGLAARWLLQRLRVPQDGPIEIYCDIRSFLDSGINTDGNLKRRHVLIAYHRVREAYALGKVRFHHVLGTENCSDFLTKGLGRLLFWKHTDKILQNTSSTRN